MTRSLYICYFGLREPLVQTQVISYLREVRKSGAEISLLTFEPNLKTSWTPEQIDAKKKELAESGITWHILPYHKRPSLPATAYDVLNGVRFVRNLLKKNDFDILHARVHIPALIAVLVRKFSRTKPKILFDIRDSCPRNMPTRVFGEPAGFFFGSQSALKHGSCESRTDSSYLPKRLEMFCFQNLDRLDTTNGIGRSRSFRAASILRKDLPVRSIRSAHRCATS
jgi:hypothetical protein